MLIKMVKFKVITFDLPRSTSFYLPVANINDMQDGLPERLRFPDYLFQFLGTCSRVLKCILRHSTSSMKQEAPLTDFSKIL